MTLAERLRQHDGVHGCDGTPGCPLIEAADLLEECAEYLERPGQTLTPRGRELLADLRGEAE